MPSRPSMALSFVFFRGVTFMTLASAWHLFSHVLTAAANIGVLQPLCDSVLDVDVPAAAAMSGGFQQLLLISDSLVADVLATAVLLGFFRHFLYFVTLDAGTEYQQDGGEHPNTQWRPHCCWLKFLPEPEP